MTRAARLIVLAALLLGLLAGGAATGGAATQASTGARTTGLTLTQAQANWKTLQATVRGEFVGSGQCVDYAYRMRSDIVMHVYEYRWMHGWPFNNLAIPFDGKDWAANAQQAGLQVSNLPSVDAIVSFQPGVEGAGSLGHVGYVTSVSTDGSQFTVRAENVGAPFQYANMVFPSAPVGGRSFIPR